MSTSLRLAEMRCPAGLGESNANAESRFDERRSKCAQTKDIEPTVLSYLRQCTGPEPSKRVDQRWMSSLLKR